MALDTVSVSILMVIALGMTAILMIYLVINRNRMYFKKSDSDKEWIKGHEPYGRSFNAAVICGVLVGFMTILFLHYFHNWSFMGSALIGMLLVDLAMVLVIAYPPKNPILAIGLLSLLVLPAAYINYSPYAYLVVGPMEDITGAEGLGAIPAMAGNTFHCVTLILTNPMAFDTECNLVNQQKAPEEPKTPVALEQTEYNALPEKDLYPGQPLTLQINFENQGDYPARNVAVITNTSSGATFRVCEQSIFDDVLTDANDGKQNRNYTPPGGIFIYKFTGKISDPWKMGDDCTYAVNKAKIDASITTNVSYGYATESYINKIEAVRSYEEDHKMGVTSALSKSAPMEILMFTFMPLAWDDERFKYYYIDVSLKNSHKGQKIIFRGKYEFKDMFMIGSSLYDFLDAIEDYQKASPVTGDWKWIGQTEQYDFCADKTDSNRKIGDDINTADKCTAVGGEPVMNAGGDYDYCRDRADPAKRIVKIENSEQCTATGGEPVYKISGEFEFCRIPKDVCVSIGGDPVSKSSGIYVECLDKADHSKKLKEIDTADKCTAVGGEAVNTVAGDYDYCRDRNDPARRIAEIENGEQCASVGGDPVYIGRAERKRNKGEYDEILVKLIGEGNSQYFKLSCDGETSKEEDEGGCVCNEDGKECSIRYVGGNGDLVVSSTKSHLFSGLKIELTDFPPDPDVKKRITTTVMANATYSVEYSRKLDLLVNNPHYIK